MTRLAACFVVALLFAFAPRGGSAGELDLTGDLSTFASPGDIYGPWHALTGTYRWVNGNDTPSVSGVTRVDSDQLAPTHSFGGVVDDYHTWSPRFFSYAAVGAASGNVLPTRNYYAEGDQKLGRALTTVIGAGFGVVVNPNGVVQRYINAGPTFYAPSWNVTLRYLQTLTTGRVGAGTGILTFQAGRTGATIATLTLLAGDQPPNGLVTATTTAELGQRAVSAEIGVKRWTGRRGGILAAFGVARLNDRLSGTTLYAQRDFQFGFFRSIGPPLP